MEFLLKNCKSGRQGRGKLSQTAQQKSPTALKRLDISIKRTLKIAHCLCLFCAIQQRKKAAAISLPQLFGGSWWIRKPRSKKQSAGLFFAVCGRPTCSNPTSSSTKKDPQPKLRVLFCLSVTKKIPNNFSNSKNKKRIFKFFLLFSLALWIT